jgi:hypothetical protein
VLNVPEDEREELKKQLNRLYEGNKYLILGHFFLTARSIVSMNVDGSIRENYRKAYDLIPESMYLKNYLEINTTK